MQAFHLVLFNRSELLLSIVVVFICNILIIFMNNLSIFIGTTWKTRKELGHDQQSSGLLISDEDRSRVLLFEVLQWSRLFGDKSETRFVRLRMTQVDGVGLEVVVYFMAKLTLIASPSVGALNSSLVLVQLFSISVDRLSHWSFTNLQVVLLF